MGQTSSPETSVPYHKITTPRKKKTQKPLDNILTLAEDFKSHNLFLPNLSIVFLTLCPE
jgi:hypothetical protein